MTLWPGARLILAVVAALVVQASPRAANAQTFDIDQVVNGHEYHSTAQFTLVGSDLHVVLTNLDTAATANGQVLNGLFWSGAAGTYGKVSAELTAGSSLVTNPLGTYTGSEVAGEHWGYANTGPAGFNQGIASAGYGLFDNGNNPSVNSVFYAGGATPTLAGPDWGLIGGYGAGNKIGGGQSPFVKNSMTFVLSGVGSSPITQVRFQYGTSLTEQSFVVNKPGPPSTVPEGPSGTLFALGLLPLGALALSGRGRRTRR